MPNGGVDNCSTCWFNAKNRGQCGHDVDKTSGPDYCTIRSLLIVGSPAYTYCANHAYVRLIRDPIPIGPVYQDLVGAGNRLPWVLSPDTEEIRQHLMGLFAQLYEPDASPSDSEAFPEYSPAEDPSLTAIRQHANTSWLYEVVVWQLGEFHETRALSGLKSFLATYPGVQLVRNALEAACKIETGKADQSAPNRKSKPWWQFWH
jgi:hypothetical protein